MGFSTTNQPKARRFVPWETVCSLRREWTAALEAAGIAPEEAWPAKENIAWLRDHGQPCIADLARRHGLHPAKAYQILRGQLYREPYEVMCRRRARAAAAAKQARGGR